MQPTGTDSPPCVVAWLGYGGLLPFLALAAASWVTDFNGQASPLWQTALLAYGAAILSFVGALHWGFAMTLGGMGPARQTASFVWSVVPALVAWVALLASPVVAAGLLVAGFAAHYGCDRRMASHADLPAWYLPMRFRLTAVACLCLATLPLQLLMRV